MANCQISSITDQTCGTATSTSQDLSTIPQGRVDQVCKEWLIREDGSLAYQLQNQEISQHYQENRVKNRTVREDIPLAKHLQQGEIFEARRIRSSYDRYLSNQTDNDEKMARQIQRRIWLDEEKAKRSAEEADERFAQKLLQKEKAKQQRKRLEKEKQQVEKLSAQIGADYQISSGDQSDVPPDSPSIFSATTSFHRILTEDEQELDLSEFCMPPPPGLTPEEMRYFLEEQDAEIARLLQHQELKRNKNPVKEKLAVIEAQDYELARMLQKMEKDRVRRIKEKSRLKQTSTDRARDEKSPNSFESHFENTNYQRTSTPISPENSLNESQIPHENVYDIPENHLVEQQGSDKDSITYEEPFQVLSHHSSDPRLRKSFHNIAIDLDPTYQRRLQSSLSANQSPTNLVESSVDDEDTQSELPSVHTVNSHDSLEKLYKAQRMETSTHATAIVTSTTSSRSSCTSSSSGRSTDNRRKMNSPSQNAPKSINIELIEQDEYAPPLPPRDFSLLARNRLNVNELDPPPILTSSKSTFLPPHHPQHPNRMNSETSPPPPTYSGPNSGSSYSNSSSSMPIRGQRRGFSIEPKPKKEKHKSQEGCRTQ